MKSRSHRLPVTEPRHDDWVDGSWTVDCTCGVNYDDGEEMVDCDECGVWVHTRCSRYVKSEKSFACDKCKNKKTGGGGSGGGSVRNESEETEVAEFLLELPTKTLMMDKPNPATVSSRRPFRLWAAIPMEERVHVQGVPGGEPDLFSGIGMSSVFGPQLWKCAGYVPKKFNYRSTEFPCLGNGEVEEKFPCVGKSEVEEKGEGKMDKTGGDENGNRSDNGAGVLLSLLKKNDDTLPTPVVDSVGAKGLVEGSPCHEVVTPREKKKMGAENRHSASPKESTKKEKSSMRVVLHCGKRRKEEPGVPKDQHAKKKLRIIEKEGDVKKRAVHSSKGASTSSSDGKHLEFSQGRGSKATINEIPCDKDFVRDRVLDGLGICATNLASNEHNLASNEHGPEATLRNDVPSDEISRGRSGGDQVPVISANVSETSNDVDLLRGVGGSPSVPAKEEVAEGALQRCTGDTGSVKIGSCEKKPVVVGVRLAGEDAKENENSQGSDTDEANSRPNKKLKGELDSDNHADHHIESLHLNDVKSDSTKSKTQYPELTVDVASEECKVVEISTISSEACEPKMLDASTKLTVGSSRTDESDELGGNASQSRRISPGSEGSRGARKSFSGLERSSEVAGELLKYNGTARSNSTASYQRKAVKSVLKSPPSSCAIISKSSENCQAATAQSPRVHNRHELSDGCPVTVKDNPLSGKVEHEENCGRSKKLVKEPSRSSSLSRVSESTRLSNASDSKRPSTDTKDSSIRSSYKATLVENMAATRVSDENANPPVMEGASNIQNKAASSAVPGKGEKFYQSGGQPSSRGHVASATAPSSSNIPATLSDEELALLLHQELNSSPRVPRVPRMRHAGSLPQIAGPSATSMLMKRTCSGGVKDQGAAPRRRNKDISGEGSHASLEVDNETKKVERKPYSPDTRRQDSGYSVDLLSRKEADGGLVKSVQSMKKTSVSSSLSSSGEANGHNVSSSRHSSKNASDDDPRTVDRQANRTLPGLIAEIMSEGKRMTYEELCNAVLPHWPHLRKHNGERYAYSSHSQAVLDCLRNRSEWARLVDRGPKTNSSKKRRKTDADSTSAESEDNGYQRVKNAKDGGSKSLDAHQEDFPKGKRKARKRRRLALQGRGIVRRKRRTSVVSDDESESFSNSCEDDSMPSEDEEMRTSLVGTEASGSSDDGGVR